MKKFVKIALLLIFKSDSYRVACRLVGVAVSVLATAPKGRGFKPG
jgi:hypothetical protein